VFSLCAFRLLSIVGVLLHAFDVLASSPFWGLLLRDLQCACCHLFISVSLRVFAVRVSFLFLVVLLHVLQRACRRIFAAVLVRVFAVCALLPFLLLLLFLFLLCACRRLFYVSVLLRVLAVLVSSHILWFSSSGFCSGVRFVVFFCFCFASCFCNVCVITFRRRCFAPCFLYFVCCHFFCFGFTSCFCCARVSPFLLLLFLAVLQCACRRFFC